MKIQKNDGSKKGSNSGYAFACFKSLSTIHDTLLARVLYIVLKHQCLYAGEGQRQTLRVMFHTT